MLGFSSDGDPRLLRSMKINAKIMNNPRSLDEIIKNTSLYEVFYIQDMTHIGTKLRNALLKPSTLLPIGDRQISVSHLKILIANTPKDIHGLTYSDICPDDRMNYKSLEKVMDDRVLNALQRYIHDSEGTVVYLSICKSITSSYLNEDLTPVERIYSIWYGVFFLRLWKNWIRSSKYSVTENFISSNAHACIELNAHAIIGLVLKLKRLEKPEMFLPFMFDSQPCERTFRTMRSMGTINYTKINFTLQELLHMVARVELQNNIIFEKLANENIEFPRMQKKKTTTNIDLPSIEEIILAMQKAKNDAILQAVKLNINLDTSLDINLDILKCDIKTHSIISKPFEGNSSDEELFGETEHFFNRANINLRDYKTDESTEFDNNRFIELCEADGSTKIVRKSTLVWLLSDPATKLSNDRAKRVQSTPLQKASKRQKVSQNYIPMETTIFRSDQLHIGEWCFFAQIAENNLPSSSQGNLQYVLGINNIVFGALMGFRFKDGRNQKDAQYHFDYVTMSNHDKSNSKNSKSLQKLSLRAIEVQADWYSFNATGILSRKGIFYLDIGYYLATTNATKISENHSQNETNKKTISFHGEFSEIYNFLLSVLNPSA